MAGQTMADAAAAAEAAEAWLPTDDPVARARILALLRQVAAAGLDPAAGLRDALGRWFGAAAGGALLVPTAPEPPPVGRKPGTLALLPLPGLRRPTLWPQRPKRLPDELFSSWLRRAAVAAGVPPRRFAREVLGTEHADTDRAVSGSALRRLALASGQRAEHLAAGTLAPGPREAATPAGVVEDAALGHGGLLLRGGRSRPEATRLQFCPRCLAEEGCPAFRRGWRFAYEVACLRHGCLLHDGCRFCGALVDPLRQASTAAQPDCPACGHGLASVAAVAAPGTARRQRALLRWLHGLAIRGEVGLLQDGLDRLAGSLRAAGDGIVARQKAVQDLPLPPPGRAARHRPGGCPRHRILTAPAAAAPRAVPEDLGPPGPPGPAGRP